MNTHDRSTIGAAPVAAMLARPPPVSRREQLRDELLTTVDSLHRRRADLIL